MSDLLADLYAEIDRRETNAKAATPGPWEAGHVWLRAGVHSDGHRGIPAGQCVYCHLGEPVQIDPAMDVNGDRIMLGHVHRCPDPYDAEHSISGADGSEVLLGTTDYGSVISAEDATYIADNDPAHVLRGLAEDRDILRRHADDRASGRHWCYVFGEDGRGRLLTILPNECPEVLSVARRLNVEVPHA